MKKLLCILSAALMIAAPMRADEGMWLLPLIQKMNGQAMKDLGCRISPEDIYSVKNSSLKDAIVQFGGGCTGEVISDRGLVVTNHHCGYSSIQKLSTPEHNYLEDGYWAMDSSLELPAPGLSVTFLVDMTDVTKIIAKAEKKGGDVSKAIKDLEDSAAAEHPHCKAVVQSFYNENVYYLIIYKTYNDVRFVGAPPVACGKFGGETDNWMWPRHTCDFSMFRIYAGKDNEPAAYSEENVPYRPTRSLNISLKGVQDGDFAMIMGYPGRTQRYMTAAQLDDMIETNDIRIEARTVRQDIMWKEMRSDDKVGLQYANKYAGSANGWKKWIGEKLAFENLDIIGREKQKEADFTAWVNSNKKRQARYGTAIDEIAECVEAGKSGKKAMTLIVETIYNVEIGQMAGTFEYMVKNDKSEDGAKAVENAKNMLKGLYKDYSQALDKKEAVALIDLYRQRAAEEDYIEIPGWDFKTMDIEAYVDYLFSHSVFGSMEGVEKIGSLDEIKDDAAYQFYTNMYAKAMECRKKGPEDGVNYAEKLGKANKAYTAGLMEWYDGKPLYPDANFTMRLTYGNVKSYSPKDGVIYKHYTTLKSVMEKEDPDNYEFHVPAKLKEIYNNRDFGQFSDADGNLVTCFLMTGDITGGNSGSPVLDADGNLIGLAFDGNWEAMSSDVMFEPNLQRCICVDIRYVLMMMDKFGGAGYLLDEMKLEK